ncbi:MAG: methylenetetrahydrofolate reductase [Candidatus Omnitrophica bacterium]|nr:methylenetetrahydrofolate reductase [Candidatus Omnitrophota bacterium]
MKIKQILETQPQGVSFEFFPPRHFKTKDLLLARARALCHYKPLYVSMTCGAGGSTHGQTKDAVKLLLQEKSLTVVPHLTCISIDFNTARKTLDLYKSWDIENVMALRGDLPAGAQGREMISQNFKYGLDLVKFIKKNYDFCVGVAVYPEGHIQTSSLEQDLEFTKLKIDAGADFAVSQMFFENRHYFSMLERMKKAGINIEVLPGILPITNIAKLKEFAAICRCTVPKLIQEQMLRYSHNLQDMEKAGIELTIKQCLELKANGINRLHFFTLNKASVISEILNSI